MIIIEAIVDTLHIVFKRHSYTQFAKRMSPVDDTHSPGTNVSDKFRVYINVSYILQQFQKHIHKTILKP